MNVDLVDETVRKKYLYSASPCSMLLLFTYMYTLLSSFLSLSLLSG